MVAPSRNLRNLRKPPLPRKLTERGWMPKLPGQLSTRGAPTEGIYVATVQFTGSRWVIIDED